MDASTAGWTKPFELAPAKINLTLRIWRKRADGYHDLESLVVFADSGDSLRFAPTASLGLSVDGATATQAGPDESNLVIKAARALQSQISGLRTGHFQLTKSLPVAAGLGGGSSDAAAALRILARINDLSIQDARVVAAARASGADVPVCLDPRPRIMRGIGEILSEPVRLPPLHAVMVNPGVPVPTGSVFGALATARAASVAPASEDDPATHYVQSGRELDPEALIDALTRSANDLEPPAVALYPAVYDTLAALRAIRSCRFARMSGSGGTCFGLFASAADATDAAAELRSRQRGWWVKETVLGGATTAQ